MKIGIPSYKRPQCLTVKTLLDAGVEKGDIYIGVQTVEDYEAYKEMHDGIEIILGKADCCAGNRNNLVSALGAPIILMDDDITGFAVWDGKNFKKDTETAIRELLACSERYKCALLGISPSTNGLVRAGRNSVSRDTLVQGSFMVLNVDERFNENYKVIDDYELSCSLVKKGLPVLRLNNFAVIKKKNTETEGGCFEQYKNGALKKYLRLLEEEYEFFEANKNYTGGSIKCQKV